MTLGWSCGRDLVANQVDHSSAVSVTRVSSPATMRLARLVVVGSRYARPVEAIVEVRRLCVECLKHSEHAGGAPG